MLKELSLLMKNYIVVILFVFILSLSLGCLALKFGLENPFEIALLFLGLFATFAGAYWGAKLSGEYAVRLSNSDKIIDSSKLILTDLRKLELMTQDILDKIIKNEITLKELKNDPYIEKDLKSLDNEYEEWNTIYTNIEIEVKIAKIKLTQQKELSVPDILYIIQKVGINSLINIKKDENGNETKSIDEVDIKYYQENLQHLNKYVHKTLKSIDECKDDIKSQF